MSKITQGLCVVAIGATAFVAGRMLPAGDAALAAQPDKKTATQPDKKAPPGIDPTKLDEMMKAHQPGTDHKRLDAMIGSWEGTVKMWMEDGSDAMESKATITREWVLDGRFVLENVTGDAMGGPDAKPFKGMGLIGFNTYEHTYETAWFENMNTNISTSAGTYDEATKTFTFTGDMIDPMTSKKTKCRTVLNTSTPGRETMTSYCMRNGKEFKCFEGTFTKTAGTKTVK